MGVLTGVMGAHLQRQCSARDGVGKWGPWMFALTGLTGSVHLRRQWMCVEGAWRGAWNGLLVELTGALSAWEVLGVWDARWAQRCWLT